MNPDEDLRQRKQQFLCEQILDKGYDAGAFQVFLEAAKPNGSDIDVWTYEEICQVNNTTDTAI
jgi:hypothetical protein